jgi:hypothetical protein
VSVPLESIIPVTFKPLTECLSRTYTPLAAQNFHPSIVGPVALPPLPTHRAMPSHNLSFPKRSLPEPPPFFSGRDLDITGWERLDWVTDKRIEVERVVAESRAKVLIANSDDSVLWFPNYGTDWIKSIGTPGILPLIGYTLSGRIDIGWPVPGRVCANGISTCLVQDTQELHCHLRDCPHTCPRQSSNRDDLYSK